MENALELLRGKPYKINSKISVFQPTLDDIFEYGEQEYFSMVSTLTSIPSDLKSVLFDMDTDYEKMSEFSLFLMLSRLYDNSKTSILFGDSIDFTKLNIIVNPQNNETVLAELDKNGQINSDNLIIDKYLYDRIMTYVRKMHGFKKKVEKAGNELTKNILIEEDRENRAKIKDYKSFLKPLIIALVNCSDFPYDFNNVWKLPISLFLESVEQIQKYKNAQSLTQGLYSGSIDGTKLNKDDLRWI